MYSIPDHPEIRSIEATGYPTWGQPEEIYCEECGRNLDSETVYVDESHEALCDECLLGLHEKREW